MNDKDQLKGTTTLGLTCKDGVVFATERRATMGNLIAHKVADKIFRIDDHIGATIAGSVSHAQTLMKFITAESALYRLRNGEEIGVESLATLTSNILRSGPLYVQTLLGGVDTKGPSLFSLDPAGGVIKDMMISTGSGSMVTYGVLEDRYSEDIYVEEGVDLAIRGIRAAMERDAFSGNGIRVATITKDEGFVKLSEEEVERKIKEIN
ncbi:MAG: archaeal proteasome endopeptidase complex subunit beta [Methanobacteriaceae archaeon]|jgi:proteasome beta subunit|nr:archaeal proteasome endopeptidase complex subunit beta [Methanobacteriaceae archaeon]OPY24118.1 MAG: Proteasome subunit beta precursor [Methanobacterium sp. PtaU1.Bin097]